MDKVLTLNVKYNVRALRHVDADMSASLRKFHIFSCKTLRSNLIAYSWIEASLILLRQRKLAYVKSILPDHETCKSEF